MVLTFVTVKPALLPTMVGEVSGTGQKTILLEIK
jgi:hypothetical protein